MQEYISVILNGFQEAFSDPIDTIRAREALAIKVRGEDGFSQIATPETYRAVLSDANFWAMAEQLDPSGQKNLEGYQSDFKINEEITSIRFDFGRTDLANFKRDYSLTEDQQQSMNEADISLIERFMIEGVFSYVDLQSINHFLTPKIEEFTNLTMDEQFNPATKGIPELTEEHQNAQKDAMKLVLGYFDSISLSLYIQKSSEENVKFKNEEVLETLSNLSALDIVNTTIENRLFEIRNKIEGNRNGVITNIYLSALEYAERNHNELLSNVEYTIELMDAEQKEDLFFILDFINKLDALHTQPNEKTLTDFRNLQYQSAGSRGSWGKAILGVVLAVLSIAVIGAAIGLIVGLTGGAGLIPIIGGTLAAVETVEAIGFATGAGAIVAASSYGFFESAKLTKESTKSTGYIKQIDSVVEQAQKQERSNSNKSSKSENHAHYKNEGTQAFEKLEKGDNWDDLTFEEQRAAAFYN